MPKQIGREIVPLGNASPQEVASWEQDVQEHKAELIHHLTAIRNNKAWQALAHLKASEAWQKEYPSWRIYVETKFPDVAEAIVALSNQPTFNKEVRKNKVVLLLEGAGLEVPASVTVLDLLARMHVDAIVEAWKAILKKYGNEVDRKKVKEYADFACLHLKQRKEKPTDIGRSLLTDGDTSYCYATEGFYRPKEDQLRLNVRIPANPLHNYEGQTLPNVRVQGELLRQMGFTHETYEKKELPQDAKELLKPLRLIWKLIELDGCRMVFPSALEESEFKRARALAMRLSDMYPPFNLEEE